MLLNRFIQFYETCNALGFVRIIKNDNILSIYAPLKDDIDNQNVKYANHAIYNCSNDELDFYNTVGNTCWITQKRSSKILSKIAKIKKKMLNKYKVNIEYALTFKHRKLILNATHDNIVVKRYKMKLFSLNNNAKTTK